MIVAQVLQKLQASFPRKRIDIFGKDSLLKTCIPYFFLAIISGIGLFMNRPDPFPFIVIIYAGLPLLDQIFSLDVRNPDAQEVKQLEKNDFYFRIALYAAIIVDWAIFIKYMYVHSSLEITPNVLLEIIANIFIVSNLNAAHFAVSHEIMHKPGRFYKILGTLHMSKMYYMHFTYHHLYNHHYKVATLQDPSSAQKRENVYGFFIRCVRDSWKGVYEDQKKLGKSFFTNYAILSILCNIAFTIIIYIIFGLQATLIHLLVAFGAVFYLEAINYIEHYGLRRKKLANGQYQKVTIMHSWNAPHRFTNYLFFKLQRHSDHHQNSLKPYQTLISLEKSPFLPSGYTAMIFMSFFPSVWFRIMDPLSEAYTNIENGEIDPKVKEVALTQTRKFLIELAISVVTIWVVSLLRYL